MKNTKHYLIVFGAVIAISVFAYIRTTSQTKQAQTATLSKTQTAQAEEENIFAVSLQYDVPDNTNTISVQVALDNGRIVRVQNKHEGKHPISQQLHKMFEAKISEAVVGQSIKNIQLSTIGGASLTTKAFVQALQQIEKQM